MLHLINYQLPITNYQLPITESFFKIASIVVKINVTFRVQKLLHFKIMICHISVASSEQFSIFILISMS
jgi:hypothetical protein